MDNNRIIRYIPPIDSQRKTKVGIYARVSTNGVEQLKSLAAQVSALTRLVVSNNNWILVDVYMDVSSAKEKSERRDFNQMLDDAKAKKLNLVITKSVSRFGRDTVDTLEALKILREYNVRVIFENDQLDTIETESNLMISIIESLAQAENESRSDNIKWGLKCRAAQGSSKLYCKKCYGYENDMNGELIIKEDEAKYVRKIFKWYLDGMTSRGIVEELHKLEVKTSTGKDKWCKQSVDSILLNEKYTGSVRLFDSVNREFEYLSEKNHPSIISRNTYDTVMEEKKRRSNLELTEKGMKRKSQKYSSKKKDK